jgi:uncharacterized protein (DUF1697 family)
MKHVVFFRSLNLGRPRCPTGADFEAAFLAAGALSADSFLTNGTMVFEPPAGSTPQALLAEAAARLREGCGLVEPGFIRSTGQLATLVRLDPFAALDRTGVHECCITFVRSARRLATVALPEGSRRGDVRLVARTNREVLSLSIKLGASPGSPNAWLERLLGEPCTTRNWNTVVRLVAKFG